MRDSPIRSALEERRCPGDLSAGFLPGEALGCPMVIRKFRIVMRLKVIHVIDEPGDNQLHHAELSPISARGGRAGRPSEGFR